MLVDTLVVFDNVAQTIKVVAHARVEAGDRSARGLRRRLRARSTRSSRACSGPVRGAADGDGRRPAGGALELRSRRRTRRSSSAPRSTSAPATSSRSCWRSASSARCAPTRSTSTAACARSIRRRTCSSCARRAHRARRLARGDGAARGPRADRAADRRHAAARHGRAARTASSSASCCADPKEIAEHIMLVDLGRNDVGRVARIGTVAVTERMVVERYSHVMHLVSNVRGELRRRARLLRRVPRHLPGRHALRRAEDPRHGDHRGARAGAARRLRRRGRLLRLLRQHGHLHRHPHDGDRRRHDLRRRPAPASSPTPIPSASTPSASTRRARCSRR